MRIKLLIDEDVHVNLAAVLRKRGFNAVNVMELNLRGYSDNKIMLESVKSERCIFSFNVRDFSIIHKNFVEQNKRHPGIIVSKQLNFSDTLKKLLKFLQSNTSEMMINRLEFL